MSRTFSHFRRYALQLIILITLGSMLLGGPGALAARAQTSPEGWAEPQNLSNSGAAGNPYGYVDIEGHINLIWQDEFAGWYFTRYADSQWIPPELVAFPFDRSIPTLHYASTGWVHAAMIDDRQNLTVARVPSQLIDDAGSWSEVRVIANPVAAYSIAIDSQGLVHLIYIQTEDNNAESAGLFYRQSRDQGSSWSDALRLYESPYLRSLTADTANLQVAVAQSDAGESVYVAMDNPARKQVLFFNSADSGRDWSEPIEIDRPDPESGQSNPFGIRIAAYQNSVMLIWKNGDSTASCRQFYQTSQDFGATWTSRQQMLEKQSGCATVNAFVTYTGQQALLATTIQGQIYLEAWDGTRWSDPFPQAEASSFVDPQTLGSVSLGCQQFYLLGDTQLFVTGCDTQDNGDIWTSNRTLGPVSDWFPEPSIWSSLGLIESSSAAMHNFSSAADSQGRIHLAWSHPESTTNNPNASAISYAQFQAGAWSQAVSVLKSDRGTADQPNLAVNPADRILVSWSDYSPGVLFFNRVDAARAVTTSRWVDAVTVPSLHPIVYSNDQFSDRSGKITLAYSIPLNEDRGIYISQSTDEGETWSDPVQVFNAAAAGWDRVGRVSLAQSANGFMHLLWWKSPLTSENSAVELYYARSEDGGLSWTAPQVLGFQSAVWSKLIAVGEKTLHAFWQEETTLGPGLKHQYSLDNGLTWSQTEDVSRIGELAGMVSIVVDRYSQIHVVRLFAETDSGKLILQHLRWENNAWVNETNLDLPTTNLLDITGFAANATSDDRLVVVYATHENQIIAPQGGRDRSQESTIVPVYNLYSVYRPLAAPAILPTPLPEQTLEPGIASQASPTPEVTMDVAVPTPQPENNTPPTSSDAGGAGGVGIIIGVGLAVILVAGAFSAWYLRRSRGY